ncbi:3D domain-containing protein [Agathobaculum sp. NTUH-O15-33]|mgnify:CR=1 FL=1|uniref:3D domain-containing protein n=1 Tax=Agathobaculum sp. NTUH-O15-33 TaxID=3079302 RepID=UPI00295894BB|nr:3D domain-containing protein [Agathobaculum sp. NTUH-O15-33]WNX83638.1 3D domain-containing protein [Agathobaculum sp. NTUH-O15-33]
MTTTLRKHAVKLLAAAVAISSLATVGAAAVSTTDAPVPTAVLTSNLNSTVGNALTSDEVLTAEQALNKAKAEAEAKEKAEAAAKAKAEAEAKAAAQAKQQSEQAYSALLNDPIAAKTVAYSSSLTADSVVKNNATSLGNYKLTFYCPCAICNGNDSGKTASGTYAEEGRTIAVDSSIIPLGSRVYIDGYGVFIAEDTGGAIKSNKIDVFVGSHERAYDLGVSYADVYLLA